MNFLFPLGFLALGSVPVLLWLWRLASSNRQTQVASLIPFEHLIRRTSTRRRRLVINWLFWLQLSALLLAALALSQPAISVGRGKTILAILDTSASMGAVRQSAPVFEQAKQALIQQLARKSPADLALLMTTAPAIPLTPQPIADNFMLTQLASSQRVQHLGGQLATAQRLGAALLGRPPDETWVFTDEPQPKGLAASVRWMTAGQALPNGAIVGVDALGPLCDPAESRVVATLQNFSDKEASVQLIAQQEGHELAKTTATLAARSRQAVTLPLPKETRGMIALRAVFAADALSLDNQAWTAIEPQARLPVAVQVNNPALAQAMAQWLGACQALHWTSGALPESGAYLLITDSQGVLPHAPALVVSASATQPAVPSHWVISSEHAIASYLAPVDIVVAPIDQEGSPVSGIPVVSALIEGKKIPIVVADEQSGQRRVRFLFDLAGKEQSTPIALVFFNSLRWLMGDAQPATTRDALTVGGWAPGQVAAQHPDGRTHTLPVEQTAVHDETATLAGIYRFTQGSRAVSKAVNFFDPLESNTWERVSTWQASGGEAASAPQAKLPPRRTPYPIAAALIYGLLILLMVEWVVYSARRRLHASAGR